MDGRSVAASGEADTPGGNTVDDDSDDEASADAASDTGAPEAEDETVGRRRRRRNTKWKPTLSRAEHRERTQRGRRPPDQPSSDSDGDDEILDELRRQMTIRNDYLSGLDRELDADANSVSLAVPTYRTLHRGTTGRLTRARPVTPLSTTTPVSVSTVGRI